MNDDIQAASDLAELKIVDDAVAALRQHFDDVEIFVARSHGPQDMSIGRELGYTRTINRGGGNWYARYGQIQLWVMQQQAIEKARAIGDREPQ